MGALETKFSKEVIGYIISEQLEQFSRWNAENGYDKLLSGVGGPITTRLISNLVLTYGIDAVQDIFTVRGATLTVNEMLDIEQ